MEKCSEEIPLSLLSMMLLWFSTLCSAKESTVLVMDSRAVCRDSPSSTVHWASRDHSFLVVGRGARDRQLYRDCSVVIGAATSQASILRLQFEAFHIEDCGVTLLVNQSQRSDFVSHSSTMAKVGCKHGNIKVLHTMEKHYVKIAVHKERARLQQYNFRINVTVIDKLPETGPETHVVIIVGVTVLLVVGTALWLLVKYLIHRTQRWQEHRAERNMERAIRLYNSQEAPPESDYMYTALPPQEVDSARLMTPAHRNGHCPPSKQGGARGGRHRAGDISFVHADGHIETFRLRGSPQQRRNEDSNPSLTSDPLRSVGSAGQGRDRDAESGGEDNLQGEDIGGECPPSYEEALHMPAPHNPPSAVYVNLDNKRDDNHTT